MVTDEVWLPLTRTMPSTSSRSARLASRKSAARSRSCSRISFAAAITARPLLNVVCEPLAPPSYGPASVSWYRIRNSSGRMPRTSAARIGRAMTEPVPHSWAPVTIVPLPSALIVRCAPEAPGNDGHQPVAMPTASPSSSGRSQSIAAAACSSVSMTPIRSKTWPVGPSSPSWTRLRRRNSTGSRPSRSATTSWCCSTAQQVVGPVGARTEPDGCVFV